MFSLPNLGGRTRWGNLGLGPLTRDLVLLTLLLFPLVFHFPLMMSFIGLKMICFSAVFVDKHHVAPHLSLVNIPNLNKYQRFEVFVSEDKQLRVVHLILDFEPLLDVFQEVGHAIKAGDLRLCQIDVFVPGFLACEDIVPIELPSQRAFLEATIPREETTSSRLSLEEEIDQF